MSRSYSLVSVVVPSFNEESYILDCLDSLLNNCFPRENLEILVMDGGSQDLTIQMVTELASKNRVVRLIHNPDRIVSGAMNLGVQNANGEIILRADCHAIYEQGYIQRSVNKLVETGAAGVGGVTIAKGKSLVGRAIAATLSLPIGTGGAAWRSAKSGSWVDSIWCGCFWKADFLRIGGFNMNWVRNQDAEFNYRLKQDVGGVYVDPEIKADYFVRESFGDLATQFFDYGWWRARTTLKHPATLKIRQVIPAMFLTTLIISVGLLALSPLPLGILLGSYFAVLLYSLTILEKTGPELLLVPVAALVIHLSWGSGFISSLVAALFGRNRDGQEAT